MNRRSMLSMLGLGAAAGPAIAENLVSQAATPAIGSQFLTMNKYSDKVYLAEDSENPLQRLNNVREHYNHLKDKKKWVDSFVSRELQEIF